MRGSNGTQEELFTLAKLDDFVPTDHPLRAIRELVNEALLGLNELFNSIYADRDRVSIDRPGEAAVGTTRCSPRIGIACSSTPWSSASSPK